MRWSAALSLGAIAAVFILGTTYLTFGVVRIDWPKHHLHATLTVPNSGGLRPHSPVLLSGVRVGEITAVEAVDRAVRVRLRIDDRYRVPESSDIRIESLSALGEPYLLFTPLSSDGPYLTDGARLDTGRVELPLTIPEAAAAAADLLGQFDPQTVADLVHTFGIGLSGTETVVPQLTRASELLAAVLLSRQPHLRGLLIDLQTIGADMGWLGPSLIEGGPEWARFGSRVREVVDALERFMLDNGFPDDFRTGTGLVPFLDQLSARLDALGPELRTVAPLLAPLTSTTAGMLPSLDISALITHALAATGDDAVRLRISVR
ncbi:MlaD family protein [Nocardia otitidiscaviarum]|uniref:MlaD family protein n=1 Tax=Nocardia otitidiscaviarum TaxID=1823 RepID=UPI00245728C1|nr:MlaD family protein [Nocardia otitidiscaviarum]